MQLKETDTERILLALYYYRSRFDSPFSDEDCDFVREIDETIRRVNCYQSEYSV